MNEPLRAVIMGVAGSGKSTIGASVAERLGADSLDADTAHPKENIDKMSAGIPLTDDDRWSWLSRLRDALESSERIVVTCSALKGSYRDVLRQAGGVEFVYLAVDESTARERVRDREGHFMATDMVESQFEALEPPTTDETDVTTFDGGTPVGPLVDQVVAHFERAGS